MSFPNASHHKQRSRPWWKKQRTRTRLARQIPAAESISHMTDLPMTEVEAEVALRNGSTNKKFSAVTVRSLDTTSMNVIDPSSIQIESMEPHMLQRKRQCKKPCFTPAMRLQNQPIQMCGCLTVDTAII